MRFTSLLGLLLIALSPSSYALDGRFSATMGVDYSTGDYGATLDTDVWAFPLSFKYKTDTWNIRISTAYLRVTSPEFVTPEGDFIGSNTVLKRTTQEGNGDINIAGTYTFLDDRDYLVGLDLTAKVKIPTADEDKFLGTGKADYGLSAEFFKPIGNWSPYWNVGFKWRGDPSGFNLKNIWSSSIGTDYRFNRDLSAGFSYDWQQKTTVFAENAQETSGYVNYYINDTNKVNLYAVTGYSNGSPNWGSGLVLIHYF